MSTNTTMPNSPAPEKCDNPAAALAALAEKSGALPAAWKRQADMIAAGYRREVCRKVLPGAAGILVLWSAGLASALLPPASLPMCAIMSALGTGLLANLADRMEKTAERARDSLREAFSKARQDAFEARQKQAAALAAEIVASGETLDDNALSIVAALPSRLLEDGVTAAIAARESRSSSFPQQEKQLPVFSDPPVPETTEFRWSAAGTLARFAVLPLFVLIDTGRAALLTLAPPGGESAVPPLPRRAPSP